MLNIAVYSNDSFFAEEFCKKLSLSLEKYPWNVFQVHQFPFRQTEAVERELPDGVYILDIRDDPEGSLAFARKLRNKGETEILVVASSPDYAMDAYNKDIMSYLLFPPETSRVAEILVHRFALRFEPQESQFSFKTASGMRVLSADRIVYVEYSEHRLLVYTDLGEKLLTTTMRLSFGDAASQLLSDSRFVRTHASFIVNIMHISEFGQAVLLMDTGVTVPVSHAKRKEVKNHFNEFFRRT